MPSEDIGHHCAVVAIQSSDPDHDVTPDVARALDYNGNRGGAGSGIVTRTQGNLLEVVVKTRDHATLLHIADRTFYSTDDEAITGSSSIGHNRYVTSGADVKGHRQPFIFVANEQQWSFAFNGNIANYPELSRELAEDLQCDVDTDAIRVLLQRAIEEHGEESMAEVFRALEGKLDGCFNIVLMNQRGDVWAYRDGHGFRPLTHGVVKGDTHDTHVICSEDSATRDAFAGTPVKITDVKPGELIQLRMGEQVVRTQVADRGNTTRCFFEWVYFSRLLSTLDGVQVEAVRKLFAKRMAEAETLDITTNGDSIAVGVPQSAIVGGKQLAESLGIQYSQVIERNPDASERSFLKSTEDRLAYARIKYLFKDEEIKEKVIILNEDSVVRGTTMDVLVALLREKGAKEVHLRVSCPPIIAPCFYGIDFATLKELLVGKYRADIVANGGNLTPDIEEAIAKELGLDSIKFLTKEAMLTCFEDLGLPANEFCTACIDGTPEAYPTPAGRKRFETELHASTTS